MGQLGGVGRVVVSHSCGEQDSTVTNPLPDRPTHLFRALPVVSASFFYFGIYKANIDQTRFVALVIAFMPNPAKFIMDSNLPVQLCCVQN